MGNDRAAIAECPKVFRGIKTERCDIAERCCLAVIPRGAVRLRAVFHHAQIIARSNVHDIRHMRGMSVQMNRDNCLETSALILDGLFQSSYIHRTWSGVNVNENWS